MDLSGEEEVGGGLLFMYVSLCEWRGTCSVYHWVHTCLFHCNPYVFVFFAEIDLLEHVLVFR